MGKRLKILSLLLCFLLLTSCSVDESLYIHCDREENRSYEWEYSRLAYFSSYPVPVYCVRYERPHVEFKSCSSFYRTMKRKSLKKKDREAIAEFGGHDGKIAIPRLDEIKELRFDGKNVVEKVKWYSCSDYEMSCKAKFEDCELSFRAYYYGFQYTVNHVNMTRNEDQYKVVDRYTEEDIAYENYQASSEKEGMIYDREYRVGEFKENGYSYRFCEAWLYERATESDEEERTQIAHFCDIEIFDGSGYYYVYLGDKYSESLAVTREFVSSFTLKSFD